MSGKIFISYRRDDVRAVAARIADRLVLEYGTENVFMDVDNLVAGQRFDLELEKVLGETAVFLAIIGPQWQEQFNTRHASGERDFVREEIATALRHNILSIPILIDQTLMPRGEELPEDVRVIALHQKHSIRHEDFGRDIAGLIDVLDRHLISSIELHEIDDEAKDGKTTKKSSVEDDLTRAYKVAKYTIYLIIFCAILYNSDEIKKSITAPYHPISSRSKDEYGDLTPEQKKKMTTPLEYKKRE